MARFKGEKQPPGATVYDLSNQTEFQDSIEGRAHWPYLEAIGRPDLKETLTPETPWAYWTMEIYRDDIKGNGGLGMLASDTLEVARKEHLPAVFITPFYTKETRQTIGSFGQEIWSRKVTPEEKGFEQIGEVSVDTVYFGKIAGTKLKIYAKAEGSVTLLIVTEPNLGELYQGGNSSDHRLYQEIALGFGGYQALRLMGIEDPACHQLNEAPTIFAGLAHLDKLTRKLGNLDEALARVRSKSIYTNHTLVQAVEAEFTLDQFYRFVFPNIESEDVKSWIKEKFDMSGGRLRLSALALELAGKKNGVSQLHAEEAGKIFKDLRGHPAEFNGVTNGISLDRWGDPQLLALYRQAGVLDEFDLPAPDFKERIFGLDSARLEAVKQAARVRLREECLKHQRNQRGESIEIPVESKIYDWSRRIAGYKRPGMVFERPQELAEILEENNAYLVMAGRAHPADGPMIDEMKRIFGLVESHPVLKQRVHFIEGYNEEIARYLAQGSDVLLNTPIVRDSRGHRISTEACGTSIFKKALGNVILESTADGGMADPKIRAERAGLDGWESPFIEISGRTHSEEVASLYSGMRRAAGILDDPVKKFEFLKKQLAAFLPIVSGARMEADYINLAFPREPSANS